MTLDSINNHHSKSNNRIEYGDYITRLEKHEPKLAVTFADFTGVEHVLLWMHQNLANKPEVDIIGQDEFHYDFLIEMEPGSRWLVFGVT